MNLIKNNLINVKKLDKIKENKLALLIKSSGYYRQKARKIKEFAKFLKSEKEINRENLLSVWGIGRETADSNLNYCKKDISYDELQELIIKKIPKDVNFYKEFHSLIIAYGKTV